MALRAASLDCNAICNLTKDSFGKLLCLLFTLSHATLLALYSIRRMTSTRFLLILCSPVVPMLRIDPTLAHIQAYTFGMPRYGSHCVNSAIKDCFLFTPACGNSHFSPFLRLFLPFLWRAEIQDCVYLVYYTK